MEIPVDFIFGELGIGIAWRQRRIKPKWTSRIIP